LINLSASVIAGDNREESEESERDRSGEGKKKVEITIFCVQMHLRFVICIIQYFESGRWRFYLKKKNKKKTGQFECNLCESFLNCSYNLILIYSLSTLCKRDDSFLFHFLKD